MKIRTDFVTNSSSSSFVVEISVRTVKGKTYTAKVDSGMEYCNANVCCDAKSLLECSSVESLMDAIYDAVDVNQADKTFYKKGVRAMGTKLKKDVQSLDELASLRFDRVWSAWGEGAAFSDTIVEEVPEFQKLAHLLCEAHARKDTQEVKNLKKEMLFFLNHYEGSISSSSVSFPTGFMGAKTRCTLDVYTNEASLVKFAQEVLKKDANPYPITSGIETTVIDMQEKRILQGASYGGITKNIFGLTIPTIMSYSSSESPVFSHAAKISGKKCIIFSRPSPFIPGQGIILAKPITLRAHLSVIR